MLEDCMTFGDCDGWMRPGAKLIAIFLSDEPDHSNRTPISFINSFDNLRPDAFVPFAIIGDPPQGCPGASGWNTQAGWGYYDVVQHYASQWFSICDEDWGTQLESLAQTISVRTIFEISSSDPHIDTVRVWMRSPTLLFLIMKMHPNRAIQLKLATLLGVVGKNNEIATLGCP